MSSKRKRRYFDWLKREVKRQIKKENEERLIKARDSGNIEEMAQALRVKLK